MQVVERIIERLELGFAAVARARIDVADVETAPEAAAEFALAALPLDGPDGAGQQQLAAVARAESPVIGGGGRIGGAGFDAQLADDATAVIDLEPLIAGLRPPEP